MKTYELRIKNVERIEIPTEVGEERIFSLTHPLRGFKPQRRRGGEN